MHVYMCIWVCVFCCSFSVLLCVFSSFFFVFSLFFLLFFFVSYPRQGSYEQRRTSAYVPTKRGHYRTYKDKDKIQILLDRITARIEKTGREYGAVTYVYQHENEYGMNRATLSRYWNKFKQNTEEFQYAIYKGKHDGRGQGGRVFTDEEERDMAIQITRHFVESDIPFANETYELFALEYWRCRKQHTRRTQWKGPSSGYITAFKKRWGFVTKVPRIEHVAKNPDLEKQQLWFKNECKKWLDYVGPHLFLNYDETFWRLLQNVLQAWGRRGQQLRVKYVLLLLLSLLLLFIFEFRSNVSSKAGMTVGLTVAADGTKLPIQVIGKGSSSRCLSKFELEKYKGKVLGTYSPRGWTTVKTMIWYIDNIIVPHTKGELAVMTWDCYACHLDPEVISHSHKKNLHIIPVPPGGTSTGYLFIFEVVMHKFDV